MTLEKQDAELFYQLWFPLLDNFQLCEVPHRGSQGIPSRSTTAGGAGADRGRMGTVQAGKVHYGAASEKGYRVHFRGRPKGLYGKGAVFYLGGDDGEGTAASGYCTDSVPGQYYFGWTGDFLPRLLRAWMQRGIQGDLQKGEGGAFNLLLFRRR